MKKYYSLLLVLLFSFTTYAQLTPPPELQTYYSGVDFNLTGTPLFDDLATETISQHTTFLTYSQRHNYLYDADEDPTNAINVLLIYSGESRYELEYQSGNNTYTPQTFNTEHVYPRSLVGNTAEGDLHHLRVCDISVNSSRANYPFTDGSGNYSLIGGNSWYPGDEWKGDVARMIMYINLRYNEPFTDVGTLSLFLQWNAEDPVSPIEDQRNTVISGAQGNRNPFIDNPYIATLIWGGTTAENRWSSLSVDNFSLVDVEIYPNPSFGNTLTIKTNKTLSIAFFDLLGKQVLRDNVSKYDNQINIENLNSGIYMIRLQSENGILTKKFIKR